MNYANAGAILFLLGLIILAGGMSMPETREGTAVSCVDDPYSWGGQTCVETTVTARNDSRGTAITAGVIGLVGGFVMMMFSDSKDDYE